MTAAAHFSQTYAEARGKFLAAATAADLPVTSHAHPLTGVDGEALAMDVVRDGPPDATGLLVLTSACHGVEGFCGSGVQVALLQDAALRRRAREAGVALLLVHALNPHGFSWWRRTTHENVDLNRNFHDFSLPLPINAAYDELAELIVPPQWPLSPEADARLRAWIDLHGPKAWQAAVSGGQHRHPGGLFYGGTGPTWSNLTIRQVLRDEAQRCRALGWIDFHTGLGPSGHGERILSTRDDAATAARARAWWGQVTSIYDGSSTSARLTGMMFAAAYEECPQAEFTSIALEYGTVSMQDVMTALRTDQCLQNQPQPDPTRRAAARRQMREAFYTDTDVWKHQVLDQAIEAIGQGIAGLSR